MRTSLVQITALTFGLVLAAAAQDFLPAFVGVKPPLLPAVALFAALRLSLPATLAVAVVAGLLCDALAGLTPCCATALFPLLGLAASYARAGTRGVPPPIVGAVCLGVAAVCGEVWISLAGVSSNFSPLVRLCAALPMGLGSGAVLFPLLTAIEGLIGLDADEEDEA